MGRLLIFAHLSAMGEAALVAQKSLRIFFAALL